MLRTSSPDKQHFLYGRSDKNSGEQLPGTMAASVDQKLRAQTKFPPEFNQKVDMQKVNVEVMKK